MNLIKYHQTFSTARRLYSFDNATKFLDFTRICLGCKRFLTDTTKIRFLAAVNSHIKRQILILHKPFPTRFARIRFLIVAVHRSACVTSTDFNASKKYFGKLNAAKICIISQQDLYLLFTL